VQKSVRGRGYGVRSIESTIGTYIVLSRENKWWAGLVERARLRGWLAGGQAGMDSTGVGFQG
jgi:hypothetical protein